MCGPPRLLHLINIYILVFVIALVNSEKIQVTIPDGILEGSILTNYDGESFYGFKRIPYAKPPVGQLRFKLAEKNEPWEGVLDATQQMPLCRQPNRPEETEEVGLENCLFLNVFTKSVKEDSLKPVMIYIHGGKFTQGSGGLYGPEFIMTEDIVLVTINYRLGVYGFINTVNFDGESDTEMIGNNGFKDQVLAMKWVQKNIKHFGGNPEQVTISGESAGGISVHGHMLSPLSTGLFHQAIAMSGTTTMVLVPTKNNTATAIAKHLGLNTTDCTTMMKQLAQAKNVDLFQATKELKWYELQLNDACSTALVIENQGPNSFISDYPMKIIKTTNYSKVPLLIGYTNKEGLLPYLYMKQNNMQSLATHIPFFFKNKKEAEEKVKKFYNLTNESADTYEYNTIDMYTDIWFKYNVIRTALEHSKVQNNDNVFFYEFAGDGKLNHLKQFLPEQYRRIPGACHADELGYLFKCSGMPEKDSMEEKLMRNVVKVWTNFVKTGRPLNDLQSFTVDNYNYVNITNEGLKIDVLGTESYKFWDNMYHEYSNGLY